MPRIAKLDLVQVNKQVDRIDDLHKRISALEETNKTLVFQAAQLDFIHARPTVNNLTFTWTGGSTTLSWLAGYIKDKNAITGTGTGFSEAPSFQSSTNANIKLYHNIAIPAGSLILNVSTFYWLGWDSNKNVMVATTDVSKLFGHRQIQIICQLFTGTAGQTGTAGGGGSQGGVDLSGARYKLF